MPFLKYENKIELLTYFEAIIAKLSESIIAVCQKLNCKYAICFDQESLYLIKFVPLYGFYTRQIHTSTSVSLLLRSIIIDGSVYVVIY